MDCKNALAALAAAFVMMPAIAGEVRIGSVTGVTGANASTSGEGLTLVEATRSPSVTAADKARVTWASA